MTVLTPSAEAVRLYECIVLLPAPLLGKDLDEALASVEQVFSEKGGRQLHRDLWGRCGLAYPIKTHREGQYVVYVYELPPSAVPAIDAAMLLEKPVLRHLLMKTPKHYEATTYAERSAAWMKEKEHAVQEEEQQKEEALKQRIVQRAARAAPAKEITAIPPAEQASLEEKLGEIISDEDLKL